MPENDAVPPAARWSPAAGVFQCVLPGRARTLKGLRLRLRSLRDGPDGPPLTARSRPGLLRSYRAEPEVLDPARQTGHHHQPGDDHLMSDYPGHDNPQLTLDPGHHTTRPDRCDSCSRPLDSTVEHWTLVTGRAPRQDHHAAVHQDPYADDGGACFLQLRHRWLDLAAQYHAGLLRRDRPDSYWTLLGDDLHCGTPLDILTADGAWLAGRYEIAHRPAGRQPVLYIALGGLNQPDTPLDIPTHALLRYRRRR